jgi:hypothetical protein
MHGFQFVIVAVVTFGAAGVTAAQQTVASAPRTTARAAVKPTKPVAVERLLPGTRGDRFPTIHGSALNAANSPLSSSMVRLRDARFGRVIDTQVTDNAGTFTFTTLDPGSYIIEVMGSDHSVVAASQIINVNGGDIVTAIVKLPLRVPPLAGLLGNSAPSAVAVTSEAVASGVLATTVAGEAASSRPIR